MIRRSMLVMVLFIGCAPELDSRTQVETPEGMVVARITVAQLASLHWIEGTWRAESEDTASFVQRYRFKDDSTLLVETYGDASKPGGADSTYFALRDGWFGTRGDGERWAATQLSARNVTFIPVANTQQTIVWEYKSPEAWVGRITTPEMEGRPARDESFEMHRIATRSP